MKTKLLLFVAIFAALGGSTLAQNNARMLTTPNAQTGTSYIFVAADTTRVVTFSNAGAVAATLPNGATFGFSAGTMLSVANLGAGTVTITCSSCTINGAATLALGQNQGADIYGGSGAPAVNYIALPSPGGTNFALLNGNNALTGNETHSGTETFTGNVSANVGQNIYAGYNINNRFLIDGCIATVTSPKYANTSAGINSAISAAIALGGGVVDATACNTLSTYNSEIGVGNTSSVPVLLLLPSGNSGGNPSWLASITGGTAFALRVFNNSAAISQNGTGYNPFFIATNSGANVAAVCGNDTTVANAHIRMEGFMCGVFGGSPTITQAVGLFVGMSDGAYIGHMTFEAIGPATVSKVLWAHGNCCGAAFHSIVADANAISGVTPCWFGNGALNDGNLNIGTDHLACVHPGSGAHNLVDLEWAQYTGSVFSNTYMETIAGADTTTSWIAVQTSSSPTGADTFIGTVASGDVAASTKYLFDIASGAHAIIIGAQQGTVSTNAVNDHNPNGGTFTKAVNTTWSYSTEATLGSSFLGTLRGIQSISDQGTACTNGELALSAGWQSTGSATVTAAAGTGQTCSWTITTGTTTAANPTVTDTLTNALPAGTTVCEMNIHGGTHTAAAGEGFTQTVLSATAPIFTFIGTPTANGFTYFVTRRCGP